MMLSRLIPLEENLWAMNEIDKTVMYIVNGEERVLLIDTGLGLTNLKRKVTELCGEKPMIVVNTHAHVDHNSGNNQFTQVHVGRFDEPFSHHIMDQNLRKMWEEMFFANLHEEEFCLKQWRPGPAEKISTVKEGDVLSIGRYNFKVLEIPGHTIGSIALFEEEKGWLFTGDTMLTWAVWGHLSLNDGSLAPSATLRTYYESLQKLRHLGKSVKRVFPAHVEATERDSYEKYALLPEIIIRYCEGIGEILSGIRQGEPYHHLLEDGMIVQFSEGGIVYDEKRMDRRKSDGFSEGI